MSADVLTRAAAVLRERAKVATPGPWGVVNGTTVAQNARQVEPGRGRYTQKIAEPNPWDYDDAPDDDYAQERAEFDAVYIAMMHPLVTLALADWLDREADENGDFLNLDHPAHRLARLILNGENDD